MFTQKTISTVLACILGVAFVLLAAVSVVELSSRISTKAFILAKINTIEKQVASTSDDALIGAKKTSLLTYNAIMDNLEHLSLTGAETPKQTIHAIRHDISADAKRRNAGVQIKTLQERKSSIEADSLRFEADIAIAKDDVNRTATLSTVTRDNLLGQRSELFEALKIVQSKQRGLSTEFAVTQAKADAESHSGGTFTENGEITSPGEGPEYRRLLGEIANIKLNLEIEDARAGSLLESVRQLDNQIEDLNKRNNFVDENSPQKTLTRLNIFKAQAEAEAERIDKEIANQKDEVKPWPGSRYVTLNRLLYMPSDMLLALTMILCGGIGAIFTATRARNPKHFPALFNGIIAGFVAFLLMKGGRFLFLVDLGVEPSAFINPYAAAFAGIIAGLFTEKAYLIMSEIADKVGEKVIKDTETPPAKG